MDNRKWEADAIASPPTAPASPSSGYPTNGNPAAAQNATEPGAWWFHAVGEELRAVIEAGGLTPDIDDLTQLQAAIAAQIAANIAPDASETVKGKVELATDAESQAFTANKVIDGAKLAAAFKGANQSFAASGYQKLPGGLIFQWATGATDPATNTDTTQTITLPVTFPNANLASFVSTNIASSTTSGDVYYQIYAKSTSNISIQRQALGGTNSVTTTPTVFAIGN